jgi:quercetin dioxygenase-like cupin family protein
MLRHRLDFGWGLLAGAALMALWNPGVSALPRARAAQPSSGAANSSKLVFENARVRVKEATFPPGALDPGMHTHALPHVGVILTAGTLEFSEPGKPKETVAFEAGAVGYREANVTHKVTNPGKTAMRVIEVELK